MPRGSVSVLSCFPLILGLACSPPAGDGRRSADDDAQTEAPTVPEAEQGGKNERKRRARKGPKPPVSKGDVVVKVLPDGSFEPSQLTIEKGATVTWTFSDPFRQSAIAPYEGGENDLTGPMPRNPGGMFVLNHDGPGLGPNGEEDPSAPTGAITDASWQSDRNVGGYLRLRWNWLQPDGEGKYDWTIVDREVEKAVANGKMYTLAVKAGYHGTPGWIFDAGVDKLVFRDFGSHEGVEECKCGAFLELGNPLQPRYQELYFEMLDALAEHLKSNAAWYRHLAYIKPSGANLYTVENRLPKRCTCAEDCPGAENRCKPLTYSGNPYLDSSNRICNTKVWADAGYTPEGLYAFYDKQLDRLAASYPEKDFVYMLIHDGFPRTNGPDHYLKCGDGEDVEGVPPPVSQTRQIVQRGWAAHKERFTIQHAGVRESKPINNFLLTERKPTQFIALQTTNDVTDAAYMHRVVRKALDTSDAIMIEVYEQAAMDDARRGGPDLNMEFHRRRKQVAEGNGPRRDPFPETHQHTFARSETVTVLNPSTCASGDPATLTVHVE